MNLFVTYTCPKLSAAALDDARCVKAVLETAQLLSATCGGPYKPTHLHHPVTKWVLASPRNAAWALQHFAALCAEYTRRFDRTHACETKCLDHFAATLGNTCLLYTSPSPRD